MAFADFKSQFIKRMGFGFFSPSTCWSAAFMPDKGLLQWAIIEETSNGPILRDYGVSSGTDNAFQYLKAVPVDAVYLSSVFPGLPTLCRSVCLPTIKPDEILSALTDTLEQTVAINVSDSEIAFDAYKNLDNSLCVTAYLAQRDCIQEHLNVLQAHSINPEWIIPKAACLAAFVDHFKIADWNYIIDVEQQETTVVLVYKGKVLESRSLVGGVDAFESLLSATGDVSEWTPSEQLKGLLQHISETLFSYKERYHTEEDTALTFTGSAVQIPLAAKIVSEFVSCPLSSLHAITEHSPLCTASAIGAALLGRAHSINTPPPTFRVGHFAFPNPLLHWKKPLFSLIAACLVMTSAILWYGHVVQAKVAGTMLSDWAEIVKDAHKTPEEVSTQSGIRETDPQSLLQQEEWLIGQIEKKSLFPLQPDIPKVSDFIAWVASQIGSVTATHKDGEPIEIQNLTYLLVKRPTKSHPQEHYQVRVDIDLSSPSVVLARALHDRFLSKNPFIDTASEIKWSGSNGKYHASFFLKDKTRYPPKGL